MAEAAVSPKLDFVLSIAIGDLPIAGTLRSQTSQPRRFDGWLELVAVMEAELASARLELPPGAHSGGDAASLADSV